MTDRQTDEQTDEETYDDSKYRASIASRGAILLDIRVGTSLEEEYFTDFRWFRQNF